MYFSLLKVFFKENFSLRRIFGIDITKNKLKAILIGLAILYGLGSVEVVFGLMFFDLGEILNQVGLINIVLIYAFIYATVLSIMFVLFRANGYLFNYKDYEILEPLPIKPKTVILAKITVMMVFIYLGILVFLAPIAFSYFYHSGFNFLSFILFLIGSLTIPLVPVVIFSFIALLISRVTSKFRKNNLLNIILLFIVFLGIMYLSFSMNTMGDINPLANQQEFMASLGRYYSPVKWFVEAVNDHNFLSFLWLLLSNAAVFTAFVFGIQKLVVSTNQRGLTKITRKNNKKVVSKKRSIISSISTKESRRFFSTPIYALNMGLGPVLLIILGIASLFYGDAIKGYMLTFQAEGINIPYEMLILIIIGFCLAMTYTTAISLSLEGKNFWVLKSLPIRPKTIMHGKMVFNVLLGLPAALLALMLFSYSIDVEILSIFIMFLLIISFSLVITVYGSLINLFVPKFQFRNPAEVVKQSAGTLLGMFGSWVILFLNGLIYYFATKSMSVEIALILACVFNVVLFSGILILVNKKAESLFIKFEV
ncbi:hypothetical protein RJI07_00575 [Mycoplasmatota bacterium WC30]